MYRITAEYKTGFTRVMIMDRETWEVIVRNVLEANAEVVRYQIEQI